MTQLVSHIRPTVVVLGLMTVLCGGIYPALSTAVLQFGFNNAANGSQVAGQDGTVVGSQLIGQNFTKPGYLWGRLSATATTPYNAASSGGSNLGVNNPDLITAVKARIDALHAADPNNSAPIPVDLVTSSASGLDPDISPAAALYQVPRIAAARHMAEADVQAVIEKATLARTFGVLGEPRVNVLSVNIALDVISPLKAQP